MGTRMAYLFVFAYFLVYFAHDYSAVSLIYVGLFWMGLMLDFGWGGSLLIRRRSTRSSSAGTSDAATCGVMCYFVYIPVYLALEISPGGGTLVTTC
jgi:hypothetical protein